MGLIDDQIDELSLMIVGSKTDTLSTEKITREVALYSQVEKRMRLLLSLERVKPSPKASRLTKL